MRERLFYVRWAELPEVVVYRLLFDEGNYDFGGPVRGRSAFG